MIHIGGRGRNSSLSWRGQNTCFCQQLTSSVGIQVLALINRLYQCVVRPTWSAEQWLGGRGSMRLPGTTSFDCISRCDS